MSRSGTASPSTRGPGRPAGREQGAGRAALLTATRELLGEKGLPRLTAREIGERAGVQPTLVNYYFGDLAGLLRALFAERTDERSKSLHAALETGTTPEERIVTLMDQLLDGFLEEPWTARLFFEQVLFAGDEALDAFVERSGRRSFDAIRRVLEEGWRDGSFRAVDPQIAVAAIGGMCIFFGAAGPLLQRLMGSAGIAAADSEELARKAADLVLNGLRGADSWRAEPQR